MRIVAYVLGLAMPAMASAGGFGLAVTGGSLGAGPELSVVLSNHAGLRANATALELGADLSSGDIAYDVDFRLRSAGVMLDVYPWRHGLRLSAGVRVSDNRAEIVARPTRDVIVGGVRYRADEVGTLDGDVRARPVAPSLAIGWASRRPRGFHAAFEAGAVLHGRPEVGTLRATGPLAGNSRFEESLARERAQVDEDLGRYRVLPLVQLALGWRF